LRPLFAKQVPTTLQILQFNQEKLTKASHVDERVATVGDKNGEWRLTIRLPSLQSLRGLKNPSNLALALKALTLIVAVIALYFRT